MLKDTEKWGISGTYPEVISLRDVAVGVKWTRTLMAEAVSAACVSRGTVLAAIRLSVYRSLPIPALAAIQVLRSKTAFQLPVLFKTDFLSTSVRPFLCQAVLGDPVSDLPVQNSFVAVRNNHGNDDSRTVWVDGPKDVG